MAKRTTSGRSKVAVPVRKRAAAKPVAKRKSTVRAPAAKALPRKTRASAPAPMIADDQATHILSAIELLRSDIFTALSRVQASMAKPAAKQESDIVAHIQNSGDVHGDLGAWMGTRRSGRWIESFCIGVQPDISPEDLVYQAILGNNWRSPWVPSGRVCGSQGLALPLRGFCVSLRGNAAAKYDCSYSASFVGGAEIDSLASGQVCATEDFAPLEAFQIILRPRGR